MSTLKYTSQFKKDLKRYKHRAEIICKLESILKILAQNKSIPEANKPHMLTGNYKGYMECHVENDTLLIWWDKDTGISRSF